MIKKVKTLAEIYILLELLLFKIVSNPDKKAAVLAIPQVCVGQNNHFISFKFIYRTPRGN